MSGSNEPLSQEAEVPPRADETPFVTPQHSQESDGSEKGEPSPDEGLAATGLSLRSSSQLTAGVKPSGDEEPAGDVIAAIGSNEGETMRVDHISRPEEGHGGTRDNADDSVTPQETNAPSLERDKSRERPRRVSVVIEEPPSEEKFVASESKTVMTGIGSILGNLRPVKKKVQDPSAPSPSSVSRVVAPTKIDLKVLEIKPCAPTPTTGLDEDVEREILLKNLMDRLARVERSIGTLSPVPSDVASGLSKKQDPYAHRRHAAEVKLYTPLSMVEQSELSQAEGHRSKPTFQTSVLHMRQIFQKRVDPAVPEEEKPTLTDLILTLSLCHDKLIRQYPIIPQYISHLEQLLPLIDNGHQVGPFLEGLCSQAAYVVANEDGLKDMTSLVHELEELYPLLEMEGTKECFEFKRKMIKLSEQVASLNVQVHQWKNQIELDMTRFAIAERAKKSADMMKELKM